MGMDDLGSTIFAFRMEINVKMNEIIGIIYSNAIKCINFLTTKWQRRSKERKSILGLCCTFFTFRAKCFFVGFFVKCRAVTTKCRNFHCVSQFNSPLMSIVLLTGTVAIAKLKHHQIPPPHQIPKRKSYNLYLLNRDTSKFILTQIAIGSHPINKNVNSLPVLLIFDHVRTMKRTFWY